MKVTISGFPIQRPSTQGNNSMTVQITFTDEEQFVLAYYRSKKASNPMRVLTYYGAFILPALLFEAIALVTGDSIVAIIAFLMLLYITVHTMIRTCKRIPQYQSIFEKYERKLAEVASRSESQNTAQ